MGFGGAIMHGLFSWNTTAYLLLREFGASKPENMKSFQARFASPVLPGDKLITQAWKVGNKDKDGFEEIRFVVSVEGGKVVLSNGRAFIKLAAQKSKL
jgi:acyl dehydratase